MSVGFGFSVGDFLAALELVQTVVDALRESGESGASYRRLVRQLYSLEDALLHVNRVESGAGASSAELVSLRQAAAQCRVTIDEFMVKLEKYHPYLGHALEGRRAGVKERWKRVQWALCREKDLEKFRLDVMAHTESIQLLLATVQMANTTLESKKRNEQNRSLAGRIQDAYFDCMQRLTSISDKVAEGLHQGRQILDTTSTIVRTNVQTFQLVLGLQQLITRIPGQIERQQPVFLVDALGRLAPFHLEFVRSSEALIAVLAVNFDKYHAGDKIREGEFVIEDAATQRDINLEVDWDMCFQPGQRVYMSMIFEHPHDVRQSCPGCRHPCDGKVDQEIECPNCGMKFRRISDFEDQSGIIDSVTAPRHMVSKGDTQGHHMPAYGLTPRKRKSPESSDAVDENIALFRRVRLRTLSSQQADVGPSLRTKVYEFKDNDWLDRGTGHVRYKYDAVWKYLEVQSEDDRSILILSYRVTPEDNFHLNDDTVLMWTDRDGLDMALSFQEAEGCRFIWERISDLHGNRARPFKDATW